LRAFVSEVVHGDHGFLGAGSVLDISDFHRHKGDFDITIEKWAPFSESNQTLRAAADSSAAEPRVSPDISTRTIYFRSPITGGTLMGPTLTTRISKSQVDSRLLYVDIRYFSFKIFIVQFLQVFGQHGAIVDSRNILEDVPFGDCFTIEVWIMSFIVSHLACR
jgi:hypothetical protein